MVGCLLIIGFRHIHDFSGDIAQYLYYLEVAVGLQTVAGHYIAIGLLGSDIPDSAQDLEVELADGPRRLEVAALPFIR